VKKFTFSLKFWKSREKGEKRKKGSAVKRSIMRALLLKKTGPPSNPLKTVNGK